MSRVLIGEYEAVVAYNKALIEALKPFSEIIFIDPKGWMRAGHNPTTYHHSIGTGMNAIELSNAIVRARKVLKEVCGE